MRKFCGPPGICNTLLKTECIFIFRILRYHKILYTIHGQWQRKITKINKWQWNWDKHFTIYFIKRWFSPLVKLVLARWILSTPWEGTVHVHFSHTLPAVGFPPCWKGSKGCDGKCILATAHITCARQLSSKLRYRDCAATEVTHSALRENWECVQMKSLTRGKKILPSSPFLQELKVSTFRNFVSSAFNI